VHARPGLANNLRDIVEKARPLVTGEVQVQTAERPEATERDGDGARHARHDSLVKKDSPTRDFADID
jgi:hypothetical protein